MSIQQNERVSSTLYAMMFITLLLVAGVSVYISHSATTGETLGTGKKIVTLNGPWKFIVGDSMQYAHSSYDDSRWETINLTAPPGAHDGDVGLSGYVPGWTAKGHPNYSGYAWYRLKVPLDSLAGSNWALAAPPAVDDAYQLFVNGSLLGNAGNFSDKVPIAYSIQPRMFLLPGNEMKEKNITIAFRVWMSLATLNEGPDLGGIHIAPTLGEKTDIKRKYRFQWEQTIKGYIVEVVLPVMFFLLATTMYLLNRSTGQTQSYRWFIAALVLLALSRLNQAVYYWFQIESTHQSDITATVILRPLMLGSWLMAWWEWFGLHQSKWIPKITAILTLSYMATQLPGLSWVSNSIIHTHFQRFADFLRLFFLAFMLFIVYQGTRKQSTKDLLVLMAILLVSMGLFSKELSQLNVIPGIWFPYGVGVSRTQYVYTAFILLMYVILIRRNGEVKLK